MVTVWRDPNYPPQEGPMKVVPMDPNKKLHIAINQQFGGKPIKLIMNSDYNWVYDGQRNILRIFR